MSLCEGLVNSTNFVNQNRTLIIEHYKNVFAGFKKKTFSCPMNKIQNQPDSNSNNIYNPFGGALLLIHSLTFSNHFVLLRIVVNPVNTKQKFNLDGMPVHHRAQHHISKHWKSHTTAAFLHKLIEETQTFPIASTLALIKVRDVWADEARL